MLWYYTNFYNVKHFFTEKMTKIIEGRVKKETKGTKFFLSDIDM